MLASFLSFHSLGSHTGLLFGTTQQCGLFSHTHLSLQEYRLCYNFTEHGLANVIAECLESKAPGNPDLVGWFFVGSGNGPEQAGAVSLSVQGCLVEAIAKAFCRKHPSLAQEPVAEMAHEFLRQMVGVIILRGVVDAGSLHGDMLQCQVFYLDAESVPVKDMQQAVRKCSSARMDFGGDGWDVSEPQPLSSRARGEAETVVDLVSSEDEGPWDDALGCQDTTSEPKQDGNHERQAHNDMADSPSNGQVPLSSDGNEHRTSTAMEEAPSCAEQQQVHGNSRAGAGGPPLARCFAVAKEPSPQQSSSSVRPPLITQQETEGLGMSSENPARKLDLHDVAVRSQHEVMGWTAVGDGGGGATSGQDRVDGLEQRLLGLRESLSDPKTKQGGSMTAAASHGVVVQPPAVGRGQDADGKRRREAGGGERSRAGRGLRSHDECGGRGGLCLVPGRGLELQREDGPPPPSVPRWLELGKGEDGRCGKREGEEECSVLESHATLLKKQISRLLDRGLGAVLTGAYREVYDAYHSLWKEVIARSHVADLQELRPDAGVQVAWGSKERGKMDIAGSSEGEGFAPAGEGSPFEVLIDHCVLAHVAELCLNDSGVEVVGVLWGLEVEDALVQVHHCSVHPRKVWASRDGHVVWDHREELERMRTRIEDNSGWTEVSAIGWFHSHLGASPLPSAEDCASQLRLQQEGERIVFGLICAVWGDGHGGSSQAGGPALAHSLCFSAFWCNREGRAVPVQWEVREQMCTPPSVLAESFEALKVLVEENEELHTGGGQRPRGRASRWVDFLQRFLDESVRRALSQAEQHRRNLSVWLAQLRPRARALPARLEEGGRALPQVSAADRSVHSLNQSKGGSGTILVPGPRPAERAGRVAEGSSGAGIDPGGSESHPGSKTGSAMTTRANKDLDARDVPVSGKNVKSGNRGEVEACTTGLRGKGGKPEDERAAAFSSKRTDTTPQSQERVPPAKSVRPKQVDRQEVNGRGAISDDFPVGDEECARQLDRKLNPKQAESSQRRGGGAGRGRQRRLEAFAFGDSNEDNEDGDFMPGDSHRRPRKK